MHKSQHIYLSGITTGALMGMFSSMFVFLLITYTIGDIREFVNSQAILFLMICSLVFIGAVVGVMVSMLVHYVTKRI